MRPRLTCILGIPAVVCINKVDLPTVTPETLQRVREQLDQFVALSKVPIIEISAKSQLCSLYNLAMKWLSN
jgi:signal recognition particle receptor subunit beta